MSTKSKNLAPDNGAPSIETKPARAKRKPATASRAKPDGALKDVKTLQDLSLGYIASLEKAGKSEGTLFSYRLDLRLALLEIGADTPLTAITPERVAAYFTCDRVTKTRTGQGKAPVSIAKTRRVFRQALVWAASAGLFPEAPLPKDA